MGGWIGTWFSGICSTVSSGQCLKDPNAQGGQDEYTKQRHLTSPPFNRKSKSNHTSVIVNIIVSTIKNNTSKCPKHDVKSKQASTICYLPILPLQSLSSVMLVGMTFIYI